jgi:hypothetical protein
MSTKYATQSTATREPFNPITPPGSSTRGSVHRAMSHQPSRAESPDFLVVTTSPETVGCGVMGLRGSFPTLGRSARSPKRRCRRRARASRCCWRVPRGCRGDAVLVGRLRGRRSTTDGRGRRRDHRVCAFPGSTNRGFTSTTTGPSRAMIASHESAPCHPSTRPRAASGARTSVR